MERKNKAKKKKERGQKNEKKKIKGVTAEVGEKKYGDGTKKKWVKKKKWIRKKRKKEEIWERKGRNMAGWNERGKKGENRSETKED